MMVQHEPLIDRLTRHPVSLTFLVTMLYALALLAVSGTPLW